MVADVQYRPHGDNRVLRHVLRQVWEMKCYWCREFKDYLSLEIDHIVPQSLSPSRLGALCKALKLPEPYDIHAVYNLAPICTACNKLKSGQDLAEVPIVLSLLNRARKLAPEVAKRTRSFDQATRLGEALLLASEVDLTDGVTRATFEEGAPAIVQRLAELGHEKAGYVVRTALVLEAREAVQEISLTLDEGGRAAVRVLEELAGRTLVEAMAEPITDLLDRVDEAIANAFRAHDGGLGAPDVGSVSVQWPQLTIRALRFRAEGPDNVNFVVEGAYEGIASASIARSSTDGGELEDVQGDAPFSCRFSFEIVWEPSDGPGNLYFDQVWLEGFEADTLVDGRRGEVAPNWLEAESDE